MPTLEVRHESTCVGWLEYFSDDESYRFSFNRDWLADPLRPVLGQFFEDLRPQDLVTWGMPAWFHHLSPQGYLRRFVARQLGVDETEDFTILGAGGDDLPGAVVLVPSEDRIHRVKPDPQSVSQSAEEAPDGFVVNFSLAGVQWKLSVRERERGLVIPARGEAGHWIAKFHDPQFEGLPRLEYATMTLARMCGIVVPEVRLVDAAMFDLLPEEIPLGDGSVFITRRFDRVLNGRIHMEDFAQVLDRPEQFYGSYEELAALVHLLVASDFDQFLLRLVFCILIGNGDAHLKNWSLYYPDRRSPRLSPAYDLVSTIVYRPRDDLALSLNGSKSFDDIGVGSFDGIARMVGQEYGVLMRTVFDYVELIGNVWFNEGGGVGFSKEQHDRISAHVSRVRKRLSRS
jgi:serine/threonine-protein kinase HipA